MGNKVSSGCRAIAIGVYCHYWRCCGANIFADLTIHSTSLVDCNEQIYSSQSLPLSQQVTWFCDLQESCSIGRRKSRFSIKHVGFVGNTEQKLEKVARSHSYLDEYFIRFHIALWLKFGLLQSGLFSSFVILFSKSFRSSRSSFVIAKSFVKSTIW